MNLGCFAFPDRGTLVLHAEEPTREFGYMNARVGHADFRMGDRSIAVDVPEGASAGWFTVWFDGERLWAVGPLSLSDNEPFMAPGPCRVEFDECHPILLRGMRLEA